jgi:hypothetical protein
MKYLDTMHLDSRIYFRDMFRNARAIAQSDAESFDEILFSLERLGYFLFKSRDGNLGKYFPLISNIANNSPLAECVPNKYPSYHTQFEVLYALVRESRNDAMHQGAYARHLTNHAVQLCLTIEDALMTGNSSITDYIVRNVIYASIWQPLSFARQQMLANSFSYLPLLRECNGTKEWHFLSDSSIAKYINKDRKTKLLNTIEEAIKDGLSTEKANCFKSNEKIKDVLESFTGKPLIIIEDDKIDTILGIVTAFDLL